LSIHRMPVGSSFPTYGRYRTIKEIGPDIAIDSGFQRWLVSPKVTPGLFFSHKDIVKSFSGSDSNNLEIIRTTRHTGQGWNQYLRAYSCYPRESRKCFHIRHLWKKTAGLPVREAILAAAVESAGTTVRIRTDKDVFHGQDFQQPPLCQVFVLRIVLACRWAKRW